MRREEAIARRTYLNGILEKLSIELTSLNMKVYSIEREIGDLNEMYINIENK